MVDNDGALAACDPGCDSEDGEGSVLPDCSWLMTIMGESAPCHAGHRTLTEKDAKMLVVKCDWHDKQLEVTGHSQTTVLSRLSRTSVLMLCSCVSLKAITE